MMIKLYLENNPIFLNTPQKFSVGFIDSGGVLTNITNTCTIEIIHPSSAKIVDTNILVMNSEESAVTVELAITYLTEPIEYISICLVKPFQIISPMDLYKTFIRLLPKRVYTNKNSGPVYADNNANVSPLYSLYDNSIIENPQFPSLNTVISRFYPDSGYPAWEQYLVGTNSLYLQPNTNYPKLLQLLYELNINNNTNPYWLAYNISRYIYYRTGEQYYVYIGENTFDISSAFILNISQLGACIFSGSFNGAASNLAIVYIMDGNTLPAEFQNELSLFIRRIFRSGMLLEVDYTHTFADFNLEFIGNTYWKDPRQQNSFCIAFNEDVLAQALGYAGEIQISYLEDFIVTLNPGGASTALTVNTSYEVIITPIFSQPVTLPIPIINYTNMFAETLNVPKFYISGGVQYVQPLQTGTLVINYYCGDITKTITYTVS